MLIKKWISRLKPLNPAFNQAIISPIRHSLTSCSLVNKQVIMYNV